MHITFLTLSELAARAGFTPVESSLFFDELCNDPHSLIQPYVMCEGIPMAIGRGALADRYYFNQDAVRVKESEVDEYVKLRSRVIAAKPVEDAKPYPVDFIGRPNLQAFTTAEHVLAWLADRNVKLTDDLDSDLNAYLMRLIDKEDPTNEPQL